MVLTNIKNTQKESGFTIVELLVVIVVIGILAAITIVSYIGISAKANSAASQSTANAVISKASAYNAEKGIWPTSYGLLTGALPADSWDLNNVSFVGTANLQALAGVPANTSTVLFEVCGVGAAAAATSAATVLAGTVTGLKVDYWKYETSVNQSYTAGVTSGTVNTFNVTCWSSAT